MQLRNTWTCILLAAFLVACSTTPGDAAYRAGESEAAADLYKQGADQGDALAALKLGLMISERQISGSKYGNKTMWYIRACELGTDAGCHNSGNSYEYGEDGLTKDYNKAREFYQKAAEMGFMQSQYNLGTLYSNQYFNDDTEGLKWLVLAEKKAADCATIPLCQWVVEDQPGHRKKLMSRMSAEQIKKSNQLANGSITIDYLASLR